jgi:DNA polymerase III delta prime subunit
MSTISWTDKYRPKTIAEIVCNKPTVLSIKQWVTDFERTQIEVKNSSGKKKDLKIPKTMKSCLLVTGSHGVGKSLAVETVLNEMGYGIQAIDFSTLKLGKNIDEWIKKLLNASNVLHLIHGKKEDKIALVIDEIETVTSSTDKATIMALQKANDAHWYCPIVFISNNQHNKLLSETKKGSTEVRFLTPYHQDMFAIMAKIVGAEKMRIKNPKVVDMIINHSQSDIRRLIYTLQDIKYAYPNQLITPESISEYCEMSKKKDTDVNLYRATNGLLYEYYNIDECLRYYETEKVLLPLMVHQNYYKSVIENHENVDVQYDIISKVADALSTGDVIENYIYGDQNWEMQEVHGFFTCVVTSYNLSCGDKTKASDEIMKRVDLDFTTDLNKTSIKKINKKNIVNTNECFKDMNIFDFIYINKIIRRMIEENKIDDCVQLLKRYNIELEHIESLLKIDKIKNTKASLTSKQKKDFIKFLE